MKVLVLSSFRLWRVIVAALANFTLGYLWYGPLFGGAVGSMDGSAGEAWLILVQFVLGVVFTFGIAWVLARTQKAPSVRSAAVSLLALIVLIVLPANAGSVTMPIRMLVDVGFYAVGAIVIALVLAAGSNTDQPKS